MNTFMHLFRYRNNESRGFTLIELLVVISIVGMLASTVLAATSRAREKARAGAFKKEIQQLQVALQMYFFNHGSAWIGDYNNSPIYPNTVTTFGSTELVNSLPADNIKGNRCPTSATSMFGDQDIKIVLDGIAKLYPAAVIECLEVTDSLKNYWTIYITAPPSSGSTWNRWCVDNYGYTFNGALIGNTNFATNRIIRSYAGSGPIGNFIPVYCAKNTSDDPADGSLPVDVSPDW